MYRMLVSLSILAAVTATSFAVPAKAEFIKRVTCQDELADSRSSDTETAGAGFQRWVACVNGR